MEKNYDESIFSLFSYHCIHDNVKQNTDNKNSKNKARCTYKKMKAISEGKWRLFLSLRLAKKCTD
jgi:hypothetical protein